MDAKPELDFVVEPGRAAQVLHPLRLRIMALSQEPMSASEIAARLGLPRQKVNYHVRRLFQVGFLRRAGRRRRRNMVEQRYVASARGYLISPAILGEIGADWRRIDDSESTAYMGALCAQVLSDLARGDAGRGEEKSPRALSLKFQFRLEDDRGREAFVQALKETLVGVIARWTSPYAGARGRSYRVVLGCYPYAPDAARRES